MHVVIFVDYPDASMGGTQTSVRAQRSALEKAGHLVTMVTPTPKGATPDDPNTIFVPGLPFSPYEYPLVTPSRRRERWIESELAKRLPIDAIHIQTNIGVGIMGIHIAKRLKIPLVQTMHTRDDVFMQKTLKFPIFVTLPAYFMHKFQLRMPATTVHRLDEPLSAHYSWRVMVRHAQQADVVTLPSSHFAERLKAHGLTKPVEIISNGLSDELLEEVWASLPPEPPMVSSPLKIAWVARLSPEKRPLICLEAVKDVPDVVIDFYGEGTDEAALRNYIKEHKLEDRVKLHGRVSQIEAIKAIAKHDILIQSSYRFDNQPMVLLEAAAVGVPAVLSDPDLAESLLPEGCVVTKTPDAPGLRDTLLDLVANPEKVDAMRGVVWANRRSVLQSTIMNKMLAAYEKASSLAAK